jgi:thiol-disulfide isomerase/thioredoxin
MLERMPAKVGRAIAAVAAVASLGLFAVAWALAPSRDPTPVQLGLTLAALTGPAAEPSRVLRPLFGAGPWLNSPPLRPADLRGKVVVVNFWTYSCINSQRALPYLRAWAAKYHDRGLVVVGVHAPEFAFEKDLANVRRGTAEAGVRYPVVLDSDWTIWQALDNQGWPTFYFIGADGRLRHEAFGEGGYEQSERLIQQLLSQAGGAPVTAPITAIRGEGPQAPPDLPDLRSEETYVGFAKAENFTSPGGLRLDRPTLYRATPALGRDHWSLAGEWTAGGEFTTLDRPGGSIVFRFHARDLHLVMAPSPEGHPVRFRITIDGAAPGADHGVDASDGGLGTVSEPRMYQLVRQKRPVSDRTFAIEFLDPGVRAYVFTFG